MSETSDTSMEKTVLPVRAVDVRKSFGSNEALRGVSLDVSTGEVVVLIGPSGSGKTTFLRCLNGLTRIDAGEVYVSGTPLNFKMIRGRRVPTKEKDVIKLRTRVTMVFQHFNLFIHKTALENITIAPIHVLKLSEEEAVRKGKALLEKVGLATHMNHYPAELSGGQKQRVAIARALAMQPEVILFDEPTSALDPELTGEVLEVMRQLAVEGTTMVVVSHEIYFAREVAQRIVMMENGRILQEGSPEEVLSRPKSQRIRDFLRRVV